MFNAVCVSNTPALSLYKKLGFKQVGTVPRGYRRKDGKYEDIIIHIFDDESRSFYDLERIWADSERVTL